MQSLLSDQEKFNPRYQAFECGMISIVNLFKNCRIIPLMLNLQVAMISKFFILIIIAPALVSVYFQQTAADFPRVDVPYEGDTVRGVVGIAGSTEIEGFISSEVFFGFSPNGEWFSIGRQKEPVSNQVIANWDTTVITDGIYRIKVLVTRSNGSQTETIVSNIRVSNYTSSQAEANNVQNGSNSQASDYLTGAIATATAFPPNPAAVSKADLISSIRGGIFWVVGIFLVTGIYLGMRWFNKKR
jgi:hypothetical protein